jgi:hypothetical protein
MPSTAVLESRSTLHHGYSGHFILSKSQFAGYLLMSQNSTSASDELSSKSHSGDTTTSRYDALPEAALGAIHAHDGPLLIDLDETLYDIRLFFIIQPYR